MYQASLGLTLVMRVQAFQPEKESAGLPGTTTTKYGRSASWRRPLPAQAYQVT